MAKLNYPKGPTIKELINYLEQFPEDLLVGFEGHFGEVYPLDLRDIQHRKNDGGYPYLIPVNQTWPTTNRKQTDILKLPIIDIGEEPC